MQRAAERGGARRAVRHPQGGHVGRVVGELTVEVGQVQHAGDVLALVLQLGQPVERRGEGGAATAACVAGALVARLKAVLGVQPGVHVEHDGPALQVGDDLRDLRRELGAQLVVDAARRVAHHEQAAHAVALAARVDHRRGRHPAGRAGPVGAGADGGPSEVGDLALPVHVGGADAVEDALEVGRRVALAEGLRRELGLDHGLLPLLGERLALRVGRLIGGDEATAAAGIGRTSLSVVRLALAGLGLRLATTRTGRGLAVAGLRLRLATEGGEDFLLGEVVEARVEQAVLGHRDAGDALQHAVDGVVARLVALLIEREPVEVGVCAVQRLVEQDEPHLLVGEPGDERRVPEDALAVGRGGRDGLVDDIDEVGGEAAVKHGGGRGQRPPAGAVDAEQGCFVDRVHTGNVLMVWITG